jgi:hypothetical protein
MKILLLIFGLALTGCISMPGDLTTTESKVEGSTEVAVIPGWLPNSLIKLGVYHDSKMKPDQAVLEVQTSIDTIQSKEGLVINIDGEKTTLSSFDTLSDLNQGFFTKRFLVKLDLMKKMVDGKSVWVRVNGNGQNAIEGEFSRDGTTTARPGFRKFLAALKM